MKHCKGFTLIHSVIAAVIALLIASAVIRTKPHDPKISTENDSVIAALESRAAKAEGCYLGVYANSLPIGAVAEFLNKHEEFEFVSLGHSRLLLKRRGCTSSTPHVVQQEADYGAGKIRREK